MINSMEKASDNWIKNTNEKWQSVFCLVKNTRDLALSNWGTAPLLLNKSDHPSDVVTAIDKKTRLF